MKKGPGAKESRQPLEDEKGKEKDSSLSPPEVTADTLILQFILPEL